MPSLLHPSSEAGPCFHEGGGEASAQAMNAPGKIEWKRPMKEKGQSIRSWLTSAEEMDGEFDAGLLKESAEAFWASLSSSHSDTLTTLDSK